jgi:hypothetical protein
MNTENQPARSTDLPPRGHCPACSKPVLLRGLKPTGDWTGLDAGGEDTCGDVYEATCPGCGSALEAYEDPIAYPADAQRLHWQLADRAGGGTG